MCASGGADEQVQSPGVCLFLLTLSSYWLGLSTLRRLLFESELYETLAGG